jgi:hypothetical protein
MAITHPDHLDEEDDEPESPAEESKGLLDYRVAMGLYAVLGVLALATLKGNFLVFMLIILGGIAVKTYVHHAREKLDD